MAVASGGLDSWMLSYALNEVLWRFDDYERKLLIALERAYWRYQADLLRRKGGMAPFVSLQDLYPYMREEAGRLGVKLPEKPTEEDLRRLFSLLTGAEEKEIRIVRELVSPLEGATFHVATPVYSGGAIPIPIRFYRPRLVDPREFGIDTESDEWRRFWSDGEPFWRRFPPIYYALLGRDEFERYLMQHQQPRTRKERRRS